MIFDRLEYFQQQIRALRLQPPVDMLLVSNDRYLSLALTQHLFKRTRIHICATLEEVMSFFKQTPLPGIVIDLDCITIPVIQVLAAIRLWHKERPGINVTLLTAGRKPEAACFIVAAAACRVIERRLDVRIMAYLLMLQPCSPAPVQANYTRENDVLSLREWNILMEVASGHSLKAIAVSLKKPYHSVVYTLGRVSVRIGLNNRKTLIYLLHELSVVPTERNCEC
ncbi:helix-turn-helix transcriptional regulator [Cedecea colo]|uniref:Helix-turn-helix transcriptional regulator n=1 Tax=Cedecea colo TaxID=2552946 RepID=A0ABX0VMC2_9ENTR|nr:helix-turn-helix transcriptional regulator [Cedecea colo]NIY48189.1 helix-turn-helix transcriptional regulator [Cedecea colo]